MVAWVLGLFVGEGCVIEAVWQHNHSRYRCWSGGVLSHGSEGVCSFLNTQPFDPNPKLYALLENCGLLLQKLQQLRRQRRRGGAGARRRREGRLKRQRHWH
jgi:hypothetical protein